MADCSTWPPNNVWYRKLTREVTQKMCELGARPDAFIANMDAEQKGESKQKAKRKKSSSKKKEKNSMHERVESLLHLAATPCQVSLAVALVTSPQPDWILSMLHG